MLFWLSFKDVDYNVFIEMEKFFRQSPYGGTACKNLQQLQAAALRNIILAAG